jgi:hypothetical protein
VFSLCCHSPKLILFSKKKKTIIFLTLFLEDNIHLGLREHMRLYKIIYIVLGLFKSYKHNTSLFWSNCYYKAETIWG